MMVAIGFYVWPIVALLMLIYLLKNGLNPQKTIRSYLIICIFWLGYLMIIEQSGVLENFGFPPRIPLLIVVPILIIILVLTGSGAFQPILKQTSLHLPVFLQSFRIVVELLIYGAFLEGIFPQRATFEGLNYDILVGISAPIIGFLILRKRIGLGGLLLWNIAAILILSLTVYSFIYSYYFTDYLLKNESIEFVEFPYLLLASILLPVAVFLHVFSIRQIILWNRSSK